MTRWAMVADLRLCVGCQTCTAACKHANATPPSVQWRSVLDLEYGTYPDVGRTFLPVGCQHCAEPPCLEVCPSTATRKRADGIVTIDYDICIGCSYCMVACPYEARFKYSKNQIAHYGKPTEVERKRFDPSRLDVANKCTFCVDRIDGGLAKGLKPGRDPEATPACAASCIGGALIFGDMDDPNSRVSKLVSNNASFRMHEELGTEPGFHYLWDDKLSKPGPRGKEPTLQTQWDWRAAANFILGGTGTGLLVAVAAKAGLGFEVTPLPALAALAAVSLGLASVWLEISRPWRALNVYRRPNLSWMSREAWVALPLFGCGLAAAGSGTPELWWVAAILALAFLYCQARILRAAKGIPAWRNPRLVPLIVTTGLAEGSGLFVAASAWPTGTQEMMGPLALCLLLAVRAASWFRFRSDLAKAAPTASLAALDRQAGTFLILGHVIPIVLLMGVFGFAGLGGGWLAVPAGLAAALAGWRFKFILITRASHQQGLTAPSNPNGSGGTKSGWAEVEECQP